MSGVVKMLRDVTGGGIWNPSYSKHKDLHDLEKRALGSLGYATEKWRW